MEKKMINRNNRTIITNRCQQYVHMRIADDFFDRKYKQQIPQQSLRFYGTRCIHVNDCTKRGTCGKTKHCICC